MLKKTLLVLALLGGLTLDAAAQTTKPPYTTNDEVSWDAPANANDFGTAQGLVYKIYVSVGTTVPAGSVLTHTCTAPVSPDTVASCKAKLPSGSLSALNTLGLVNVELTATAGSGTTAVEGPKSVPFVLNNPPAAPTKGRLSR